jgi:hypothetical protein
VAAPQPDLGFAGRALQCVDRCQRRRARYPENPGLISSYGLQSFLEAVFLEVHDTAGRYGDEEEFGEEHVLKAGADDEDFLEARRVHDKLDPIIGWQKETQ